MENERWEERVRRLERRQRRLWTSSVAAWTLLATACLSGAVASGGRVVRAQSFVLVGPDGEQRGSLMATEKGAGLHLEAGAGIASIGATDEGAWTSVSWDDEYGTMLLSGEEGAHLYLEDLEYNSPEDEEQPPPAVELSVTGHRGTLVLRRSEEETYRAP